MYLFIVNPIAGGGRSMRILTEIQSSNIYDAIESTCCITQFKGHAEKIVKEQLEKTKVQGIFVIGGDGTFHEVVNGLNQASIPLAFIPGGSGNDFARGCSIDRKPVEIVMDMLNNQDKLNYFLGNYQVDNNESKKFVNNIGFGFDAQIAEKVNKSKYKQILNKLYLGKISYVIALLQVLIQFKPMNIMLEIDGRKREVSDCLMVTIANHPYYGGGMKIIPTAKIQASVFPILLIRSVSKWKLLAVFITVFTGRHMKYKEVELIEATNLIIKSNHKLKFQVDGETDSCYTCKLSKQSESVKIIGTN